MRHAWTYLAVFSLLGCNGDRLLPSAGEVGRAALQVAPRFAPQAMASADPVAAALAFVRTQASVIGADAHAQFSLIRQQYSADGLQHVRLQQAYDGVKVWGSDIVVHADGQNITGVDGTLLSNLEQLDLSPSLSPVSALGLATANLATQEAGVVGAVRNAGELVILPREEGAARLAWHVIFEAQKAGVLTGIWNYFIDAHDGSVLERFNNLQTLEASGRGGNKRVMRTWDMTLDVTQSGQTYAMKTDQYNTVNGKTGETYSGDSLTDFNDDDIGANDAHGFAEITVKMLKEWQGYDSIDDKGFRIVSYVHHGTANNASWDGQKMNYGDGNQTTFFDFTGSLDVIAHEIDHGFTSFHSNLTYSGQSGGMNESFSDIAGTAAKYFYDAKTASMNLGGDIFVKEGQYIRYLCTPSKDGKSIDDASDYKSGLDVHYSSGVMNRAFCRSAKRLSGVDPDTGDATVDGVKRASKVFYEANASHWTASSNYKAGCQGVIDAATALKLSPGDISALGDSWKDVGVTCDYKHVNDFGLTLTPDKATVQAGSSTTFTVATTVSGGNTPQPVDLTISGLPAGATGTFDPAQVTSGASSTLTITTTTDTTVGDATFTVSAAGEATRTVDGTLTVTEPPPPPDMGPPDVNPDGSDHKLPPGAHGCSFGDSGAASPALLLLMVAGLLWRRRFSA